MTAPVFVDTNILVYAHDLSSGRKSEIAGNLLRQLWDSERGAVSLQVLNEYFVNVTRKIPRPLSIAEAQNHVRRYGAWIRNDSGVSTSLRAIDLMQTHKLSFWDCMVIAAAEEAGAAEIVTEDLNHGQIVAGVRIVNPFR